MKKTMIFCGLAAIIASSCGTQEIKTVEGQILKTKIVAAKNSHRNNYPLAHEIKLRTTQGFHDLMVYSHNEHEFEKFSKYGAVGKIVRYKSPQCEEGNDIAYSHMISLVK